jgi:hypothetical protein
MYSFGRWRSWNGEINAWTNRKTYFMRYLIEMAATKEIDPQNMQNNNNAYFE